MPAAPPSNVIGSNIAAARLTTGMTQLALAHALGWRGPDAGAQVSRIESGKVEPKLSTLQRLADALGVTLDSLLAK